MMVGMSIYFLFQTISKRSPRKVLPAFTSSRKRSGPESMTARPSLRANWTIGEGWTVLVHGGIGREFSPVWGDLPPGWHQLCVSPPDFMLLGNETDFTAMRAWKLLQQMDDLEEKGVVFPNLRGFLNLAAFAYYGDFELVPINMSLGPNYLHSDFILPLRHRVRTALDRHAAVGPDGESWVGVQRETTSGHFGELQGRPVFFSPAHRAHRELLACVESASRPWWVQCEQLPEAGWHHDIVFGILDMVLGWLVRLAPMLEERLSMLPSGPVTIRLRFPDIETFSQRDSPVAGNARGTDSRR